MEASYVTFTGILGRGLGSRVNLEEEGGGQMWGRMMGLVKEAEVRFECLCCSPKWMLGATLPISVYKRLSQ